MTCHCQVIIACGLTEHITLLSPLSISSLWREGAPFRERSGGGLAAIGLTTGKNLTHSRACGNLLTKFSYTDTDLDPYNAERGFWWVSNEHTFQVFRDHSLTIRDGRSSNLVSRRLDARKTEDQARSR